MKRQLFNLLLCLSILWISFIWLSEASILSNWLVQAAINNREYSDWVLKTKSEQVSYGSNLKIAYICKDSYNCGSSSAIFKVKYDTNNKVYYICSSKYNSDWCSISTAIFQIQNNYICPAGVFQTCNSFNSISFPLIPVEEIAKVLDWWTSSRVSKNWSSYNLWNYWTISNNNWTYYICIGWYSCSKSSAILQMKKDGRYYYVCDWNEYSCSNSSSIMQINSNSNSNNWWWSNYDNDYNYDYNTTDWDAMREEYNANMQAAWDEYHNNMCKIEYWDNAMMDPNNENACVCMEWYTWNSSRTSCVSKASSCSMYWPNSYLGADNLCYCKAWYQWNNSMTSCIKSQTTNTTKKYFSDYKLDAYNFAFANWITTMDTIEKADMYWTLDRIAMAKMIWNYAVNILWLIPDVTLTCYFPDVPTDVNVAYDNWVTKACQLWLMWQWITNFRPRDKVTRAEFATVLSRLINRNSDDLNRLNSANPYYSEHMKYLQNNWIIDSVINLSEYDNELRWYVMLMLMRANDLENTIETNCTAEELVVCSTAEDMDACISECEWE